MSFRGLTERKDNGRKGRKYAHHGNVSATDCSHYEHSTTRRSVKIVTEAREGSDLLRFSPLGQSCQTGHSRAGAGEELKFSRQDGNLPMASWWPTQQYSKIPTGLGENAAAIL